VEKNDAFTSIEQESQGDIGVADYNSSSNEQIIAENQAKDVQDEQELPGHPTHHNEIINSVGEATDGNDDPSKDPDHMIDAENTIIDEPNRTHDSMEINIVKLTQTGPCTQYILGKCTCTIIQENVHVQLSGKMYMYNYPGKCTCTIILVRLIWQPHWR
jgi:hypothetical protein